MEHALYRHTKQNLELCPGTVVTGARCSLVFPYISFQRTSLSTCPGTSSRLTRRSSFKTEELFSNFQLLTCFFFAHVARHIHVFVLVAPLARPARSLTFVSSSTFADDLKYFMIKPHDLLVLVSSMDRSTYTPSLSTSSSIRGL